MMNPINVREHQISVENLGVQTRVIEAGDAVTFALPGGVHAR